MVIWIVFILNRIKGYRFLVYLVKFKVAEVHESIGCSEERAEAILEPAARSVDIVKPVIQRRAKYGKSKMRKIVMFVMTLSTDVEYRIVPINVFVFILF